MNNNFTTKECISFEEVMQCLQMAMKNYPFERSHRFENSHTNCFFRLTLHQQLMQAGKNWAMTSLMKLELINFLNCSHFGLVPFERFNIFQARCMPSHRGVPSWT